MSTKEFYTWLQGHTVFVLQKLHWQCQHCHFLLLPIWFMKNLNLLIFESSSEQKTMSPLWRADRNTPAYLKTPRHYHLSPFNGRSVLLPPASFTLVSCFLITLGLARATTTSLWRVRRVLVAPGRAGCCPSGFLGVSRKAWWPHDWWLLWWLGASSLAWVEMDSESGAGPVALTPAGSMRRTDIIKQNHVLLWVKVILNKNRRVKSLFTFCLKLMWV